MKGKMIIEVDEKTVNLNGSIQFSNDLEPYFVVAGVAKCLNITTTEQFARLAVVAALPKKPGSEKFEQTMFVIPKKTDPS